MNPADDLAWMAQAMALARRGRYGTSPNPAVGCVLVRNGQRIGEGWHRQAGGPHAEIHALQAAGDARGATAYVTLEPCSHHGRTPPCADALVAAGIARLVYGMQDPNPAVAGRGLARLAAAGIAVHGPLLEADAQALNTGFIHRMRSGLPYVIGKSAASLDGRTAMASGESQWITGPAARADVQKLRAASCAILTGIGTVLQDDPQLTVRDATLAEAGLPLRQPLRVIVDSRLRIPLSARVLAGPGQALVVYATAAADNIRALQAAGVECLQLAGADGRVDLPALLAELGRRQVNQLMVEAGSGLTGSLVQQGLLNEWWLYMAPTVLGSQAQPLAGLSLSQMAEQRRWQIRDIRRIGDDVRWQLLPAAEEQG